MACDKSPTVVDQLICALSQFSTSRVQGLLLASDSLTTSFREQLKCSQQSMLPSYTQDLPSGKETGAAVALDLGGSTLRVAVVKFRCGDSEGRTLESVSMVGRRSWHVNNSQKQLPSRKFFDWIADCIADVLFNARAGDGLDMEVGLTWSFPVESISVASGRVQEMGKGYEQWKFISGTDLKQHFESAFRRKGLRLQMKALMNDTEATLLSHAYYNPATRISLIWGTGINAAMYLPLQAVSISKLGKRPKYWTSTAEAVLINTEVSMSGAGIFPMTEADHELDRCSSQPGFQPLEQLTSGRYLGEICRLTLLSAIKGGSLFNGCVPKGFEISFSFDTSIMSLMEEGDYTSSVNLLSSIYSFVEPPSNQDVTVIRQISNAIIQRAATYMAIALFSLYRIQQDSLIAGKHQIENNSIGKGGSSHCTIAYCGAVAEKHPTARARCQSVLDVLMQEHQQSSSRTRLVLEASEDSGLLGAAVGAVMHRDDQHSLSKL